MAKRIIAKIISQKKIKQGCFKMAIASPLLAKTARPGQFLHILCGNSSDPLLRRPISAHRINKNSVEILYNAAGRGTEILSKKRPGDKLDIVGPLGRGFDIYKNSGSIKVLVAGGMGVAPLLGLAEELKKHKIRSIVILGAKTKNHILCAKEFKRLGAEVHIATEDGSMGKKRLAADLAREIIHSKRYKWHEVCVYAAGPIGMIKALCRLMEGCSLESQVSLEERMACGLGACLGCVVDTQAGYKRVCKDGPVFRLCDMICE